MAVVLASLSAVRFGGRSYPLLAFTAIALLAVVGIARLRDSMRRKKTPPAYDPYERAMRIQRERDKRYWR